ncbi:uncharacterized protein JCM10292_006215 [Rhodotorula paludigena]|uniref:uncharacterized protein n=1 Tax=Rhodotorula paludigena TaxID=86838 RepID=UPI0031788CFB
MQELTHDDSFRLGRLRLIRLPPAFVSLPLAQKQPVAVPVELAVAVTDDYGTDLEFDSLDLKLELVTSNTLEPPAGISLSLDGSSRAPKPNNAVSFTFSPARGPFHPLKLVLSFAPPSLPGAQPPEPLGFRLSAVSDSSAAPASTSTAATARIRSLIGEERQVETETWDGKRYVMLPVASGAMEVKLEGKEARVAAEKVQTTLRTIHLPPPVVDNTHLSESISSPPPLPAQVTIVERPGLNNSTGQRLWDCAVGLSAYLSLNPSALDPSHPLSAPAAPSSSSLDSPPAAKKSRTLAPDQATKRPRLRIVELGAGCALASMTAWRLSSADAGAGTSVAATDVETTVESTLVENLRANGCGMEEEAGGVEAKVLEWGALSAEQVDKALQSGDAGTRRGAKGNGETALTLLGADILYNPSSHDVLLSTLLSFLRRPASTNSAEKIFARALIAYKRRTEGDDAFFDLARKGGLEVDKVWEWGEVSVWSFV